MTNKQRSSARSPSTSTSAGILTPSTVDGEFDFVTIESGSARDPDVPLQSVERGSSAGTEAAASRSINEIGDDLAAVRLDSTSSLSLPSDQEQDSRGSAANVQEITSALRQIVVNTPPRDPAAFHVAQAASRSTHLSPSPEPSAGRALSPSATPSRSRRRRSSRLTPVRHEVSDEQPPEERFHNSQFQTALRDARALMVRMADVLATSASSMHNEPDTTMKRLFKTAQDLSRFEGPETRTVGFVGDSGVGEYPGNPLLRPYFVLFSCLRTQAVHQPGVQ